MMELTQITDGPIAGLARGQARMAARWIQLPAGQNAF